ncbi:MAG: peptidoglycan-binding protein [Cyanobacteria bacterium CRU_2_1]|nr:peptidoglycan-binding protein [Cyanobacteria bacterium RU_5_0]NJR59870.1 peptidoglycan-binding protein [Cyanobacteria bacterium CRU_2_1]
MDANQTIDKPHPDKTAASDPTVYPWDIGAKVAEVQELLRAHGFHLILDGDYGWKTEAAVKRYQKRHGLRVDGVVGSQTWASLRQTIKPRTRPLGEGCSGADVYELQGLLRIAGFAIKRDGFFGAETKSAVVGFQRHHHLKDDGIVNAVTWAVLGEKLTVPQQRKRKTWLSR